MTFQITSSDDGYLDAITYRCFCPMFGCTAKWIQLVAKRVIKDAVVDVDKELRFMMEEEVYTHLELEHDLWRENRVVYKVHRNLSDQGVYFVKGKYFDAR
jgi:hypothetical protein